MPILLPLSKIRELAVVEAPVYLTKKLAVPEPESLLLKVNQSEAWSWPVLTAEEKGRFKVKVLPKIEPLKMLPVVPVANTVTPVSVAAKVICPAVVVVIVMLLPATRLVGAYFVPVPSAARICPVTVGAVDVPVPPLETPNMPETSEEPRAMAPLNNAPPLVDLTGRAEEREERVVEPVTVRVPVKEVEAKYERPETVKALEEALPKEEVAVAVMLVKEGLEVKVIWVEVPIKTC